ncbi:MAG: hypothetical protein ACREAA_02635 [Candidatus Polarisedimenticolia bacterium]
MRRSTLTLLIVSVCLNPWSTPAQEAGPPSNRVLIQAPEQPESAGISLLQRGIRSYGVGALRPAKAPLTVESLSGEGALSGGGAGLGPTTKISGTPMAGGVTAFRVTPDGTTAVFIADKDTLGRFELYSAPVNGSSAPIKISTGLVFGTGDLGVSAFQITPDGTRVVFLADPNTGGGLDEIFSAPINGSSAAVRLNTDTQDPITGMGITLNGTWAVYFGVDTASASGAVEVFRATIGTPGSGVQLSDAGLGNSLGDVVAADFSPDSTRVVYAADAGTDNVFQFYSVPIAATGPGADVQLSAALGSATLFRISPDSTRVVYASDDIVINRQDIFSKPIAGGARVQLNPSMAGEGVTAIEINADGTRVAYLADQDTIFVTEVYGAQMLVAGSGARLNTPLSGSQFAGAVNPGPDAVTTLFEADQDTPGTQELFRVPITGGSAPVKLHDLTSPDSAGSIVGLGIPILGRHAVYPVFGSGGTVSLFSAPFDGSGSPQQVNDALAAGDTLFNVFLPSSGRRLMAWGAGPSSGSVTRTVLAGPIRSDLAPEQINVTAGVGALGVLGYEINAGETHGVYLQDKDTAGKPELYNVQLDSDGDGVLNASDNCMFVANPSQSPVVFPATVTAVSSTMFTWSTALDVRFVRGPIGPALATNASGTLKDAITYTDLTSPPVGSGWYYLLAPDCPGRSYQTVLGAEPGRDLAAFP